MDESPLTPPPPASDNLPSEDDKQVRRKRFWRRFGGEGFLISLGIHVVCAIFAFFWIVSTFVIKPKTPDVFDTGTGGGQKGENARMREYKVKMNKIRNTVRSDKKLSVKNSKNISLADVPALDMSALRQAAMEATASKGAGGGFGGGEGDGSGIGKGAGKNFVSAFLGTRYSPGAAGLVGRFYDLKINPKMQPSGKGMDRANSYEFKEAVDKFVAGNWSSAALDKQYYCVPTKLVTTQLFFGKMPTKDAPKAFEADGNVGLDNWIVVYRGTVRAPFSGEFRFVGYVADGLFVRFNNKLVLESNHRGFQINPQRQKQFPVLYESDNGSDQLRAGSWISVTAGKEYPIEICIADAIPGTFRGFLLIEQKGATYRIENGAPKLPIFRCGDSSPPAARGGQTYPPHTPDGPIFQAVMPRTLNVRR